MILSALGDSGQVKARAGSCGIPIYKIHNVNVFAGLFRDCCHSKGEHKLRVVIAASLEARASRATTAMENDRQGVIGRTRGKTDVYVS